MGDYYDGTFMPEGAETRDKMLINFQCLRISCHLIQLQCKSESENELGDDQDGLDTDCEEEEEEMERARQELRQAREELQLRQEQQDAQSTQQQLTGQTLAIDNEKNTPVTQSLLGEKICKRCSFECVMGK